MPGSTTCWSSSRPTAKCVIYQGIDPDSDFSLVGIFRFDSPMSKHCVVNYGGDLYVLISTGLVPMSTLLRAESEQLGQEDRNIFSMFFTSAFLHRDRPGWGVILNHSSGRMICNMPQGFNNSYRQVVRLMPNAIWSTWSGHPSRCWAWIDNRVFYRLRHRRSLRDPTRTSSTTTAGPIRVDVQPAWSSYGSSSIKQFKMLLAYIITDGVPKHKLDFRVDYDSTAPQNVARHRHGGGAGRTVGRGRMGRRLLGEHVQDVEQLAGRLVLGPRRSPAPDG